MKNFAFVFARGGSKGLLGKNIKPLAGKPLINYSIEVAKNCPSIDEVFVSTDDTAIAEVARQAGAVIIERPDELASDTSPEWLSWVHAINWVEHNYGSFQYFVSLPATSPLRSVEDVESSIVKLESSAADFCISVTPASRSPYFNMVKLLDDESCELVIKPKGTVTRRQDAPDVFDITTVVYTSTPNFIRSNNSLFSGKVTSVVIPKNRAVDIDDIYDFLLAEAIVTGDAKVKHLLGGECILVAGAGGLLGSQVTKHALSQGARVIAADIGIDNLKSRLIGAGVDINDSNISCHSFDITVENEVIAFFESCEKITGAVNCTYPRNKAYGAHFFDVKTADFNENLALHLGSAFLFTQQCAKYFSENGHSFSLVNISSIYGVIAPKFEVYENTHMTMPVEYAAIKSAILHLTKYTIKYVNNSLFRINSVSSGGIFDSQPDSFLQAYKSLTNGEGMLDVNDVIGSIMFLLSPEARFVTGQNIIVDDGFSL
ncbi:oxidoreductase [Paraglaciecola aquimarina]|uniref:Oxidoreductase n=1 Tax=Paraglaciecola aquimarina TaxID=1235557 RepID=A0ABU3T1J0_9ALTE|nr:oxidoreductase [Paraglaciecola aquimarina]MDU0356115.1 oxidoreductase [Paraglaciecola aquimarina]